jgi:hypothetical protein
MLDHAFLDVISALRRSFADALLDHHTLEERFQSDLLLGDLSWESSYSVPGEGNPPRVRADLSLDWPTWSQTAYRAWTIGEPVGDPPELGIELVLRVQGLAGTPDVSRIAAILPSEIHIVEGEALVRAAPTVEQAFDSDLVGGSFAVEFAYEGAYELTQEVLDNRPALGSHLGGMGRWVASTLVRLGDLGLAFTPDNGGERSA